MQKQKKTIRVRRFQEENSANTSHEFLGEENINSPAERGIYDDRRRVPEQSERMEAFPPTRQSPFSVQLDPTQLSISSYEENIEKEKALTTYMNTSAVKKYKTLGLPLPEVKPKKNKGGLSTIFERSLLQSFTSPKSSEQSLEAADRQRKLEQIRRRTRVYCSAIILSLAALAVLVGLFTLSEEDKNQGENENDLEDDFEIPEVEDLAAICAQVDFDLDGDNAFCISDTLWVRCVDGQIDPDEEDAEVRNCVNSPGTGLCPCALNIVVEDSFPCGEDDVSNDSINCDPVVLLESRN
eukprot:snap_masked-scaffold_21-processed-gene-5.45-mRNA-1 protein AED:1.00 eAED:1.00 QI:0/-1/0/0/-1/1/1/0/295